MKVYEIEQGGVEWAVLRHARPTCSEYHRILTPAKRQYSAKAGSYQAELLAAWALGGPLKEFSTGWTERGKEMEDEARAWYEWERDVEVRQVGFIARDDDATGGSPDGLVGDDGGVEIKILGAANHVAAVLQEQADGEFHAQIQGNLYLTGRAWWDLVLFNPRLPSRIIRVPRDEPYIALLDGALDRFLGELEEGRAQLIGMGYKRPPHLAAPIEVPPSWVEETPTILMRQMQASLTAAG